MNKIKIDLLNDCACTFEYILDSDNDLRPVYKTANICLTHKEIISKYKRENAHLLAEIYYPVIKGKTMLWNQYLSLSEKKKNQIIDFMSYVFSELIRDRYDNFLDERNV